MNQRILLAGSTGLVGGLVKARIAAQSGTELTSLVRRGSTAPGHAIDYEELCKAPKNILETVAPGGIDTAISCLGTTIRTAGSQPAMFRIDHDYVLAVAQGARALGARQFILVSSAGAGGPGFYLQTKGRIEEAVNNLGFERVDLIRPGFLIGSRSERRVWETIGQYIFAALTPVLLGPLARYGAIPADTVADAIAALVGMEAPGLYRHENSDLRILSALRRRLNQR
ncbi:hypothetical protein A6U87_07235 [Rhizobium sp. AC44/96]|uniref:hypothetical protein n=1 Tax=Rhizobium sp. AC44/96 TaxID=1841654 RepID=UPI0008100CEA|nr:hypothetical protein [Rhizobium sp. AC44/96]OCJ13078.1 hypothetical protein A6U87_07235 [Rhizobium sp. AC44/96]